MAWRVDEAVEHGLIDNTVEGHTTGKIWLVGRDEPLILSLNGDCWRDLAGTVLEFENPSPKGSPEVAELDTEQTGIVGDITASRKARIPEIPEELIADYDRQGRDIPFHWRNVLYLEWFSEINGRVLIEAAGYTLKVSGGEWEMDEDQEEAQKLANLSAMRDFLTQVIRRAEPDDGKAQTGAGGELDEFEWEERLKESDRLTDAYQEVLEKYIEDVDSERKEAFVMGWDGLLGAMAERDEDDEGEDMDFDEDGEDFSEDWRNSDEDDEEDDDDEEDWLAESHPLQTKAREVAMRCFDLVSREDDRDSPAQRLVSNVMQVSAKLAGVLHGHGSGYEPEAGFVLAVLKRCLNWINEAIGACGELIEAADEPEGKAALGNLRSEIFGIRDGIIELRQELKRS